MHCLAADHGGARAGRQAVHRGARRHRNMLLSRSTLHIPARPCRFATHAHDSSARPRLTRVRKCPARDGADRVQARRRFTQAATPSLCLTDRRSIDGNTDPEGNAEYSLSRWRTKDRIKTQAAALILCLNIGVDPPDVVKVSPCARLQCWVSPDPQQAQRNTASIARALQAQYERWQPRAKYKVHSDPTVDDVKRLCREARRTTRVRDLPLHPALVAEAPFSRTGQTSEIAAAAAAAGRVRLLQCEAPPCCVPVVRQASGSGPLMQ
jgi:Raptor N-terminal CASPase like domain